MALRLEEMLLIDGYVLGGCWGLIRLSPYMASSDSSIGTTHKERGLKWFFLNSPTHISAVPAAGRGPPCTQIQARHPGPVLINTSVFLKQSNQGKFRTHFGHGSAALTKIHQRAGPTVLYRGHHQLREQGQTSSTSKTEQDAKNEITYWKLVWGEEFQ